MYVRVYKSITEIGAGAWDEIVGKNQLICTHNYLKAVEKSQINDCRYYYLVLYEGNQIVAHTCLYFISTYLDIFAQGVIKNMINIIRKKYKKFFILESFECGTPVALGTTISFRNHINRLEVIERIIKVAECLAKECNTKVLLFRDFYEYELYLYDYLMKFGYNRIRNLPSTRINVRWGSFDEYLSAMRSKYRWKVKERMKNVYEEKISIEVRRSFLDCGKELERLWTHVYNNAKEYKRERLKAVFFENIDKYLGESSAIIMVKREGILIGFTLLLFDEMTLIPLFTGLDYNYNDRYSVYFNLLYKSIEVAIREGKRDIDLGITTLESKREMGAVAIPLYMYMKHLNPLFNKIVPRIFEKMIPQDTTGPRRVFKAH
ncbi:MAG: GNAT family N-acetyltransferase [bacterium]